jgi:hypothetical protein
MIVLNIILWLIMMMLFHKKYIFSSFYDFLFLYEICTHRFFKKYSTVSQFTDTVILNEKIPKRDNNNYYTRTVYTDHIIHIK